jgi:hypothetical protein
MIKAIAASTIGMLMLAGSASAQMLAWKDRGFINVSGGGQVGSTNSTSTFSFPLYEETATISVAQKVNPGFSFDVTGAARVTGNIGVGLSFTHFSTSSDGALTASIPDPIVFDSPRSVTGTVSALNYKVNWIGILGFYAIPMTDKIDVFVFGGPAVAKATQDVVGSATSAEGANGPTVAVTRDSLSRSFWGFEVGADMRYLIARQFGVGGFVRYNRSTGNFNSTAKFDGSGLQLGGGVRIKF